MTKTELEKRLSNLEVDLARVKEFVFYADPNSDLDKSEQLRLAREAEPDRYNDFVIITGAARD